MELSHWVSWRYEKMSSNLKNKHSEELCRYRNCQLAQISQNDEVFQSSSLVVCFFISSGSLENCFSPSHKITPELLTNSCKIDPTSLPSSHVLFWVNSKRQNRLLTLPDNFGDRFCCCCFWREQKPQIAYLLFSGQNLFLEHCGWVLRSSSVFVLNHSVRRHLTLKFYFPMYWLDRTDLPPPLNLPCQLSFLTK